MCLDEIRESTIKKATQESITTETKQLAQLAKDLIEIDNQVKTKIRPAITKLDEANDAI